MRCFDSTTCLLAPLYSCGLVCVCLGRLQKEYLGMPSDTYDVVAPSASVEPNKICCIGEDLPLVFRGSMFPEKIE